MGVVYRATDTRLNRDRKFLSYWKDGDIDRDKIAEAVKKTS